MRKQERNKELASLVAAYRILFHLMGYTLALNLQPITELMQLGADIISPERDRRGDNRVVDCLCEFSENAPSLLEALIYSEKYPRRKEQEKGMITAAFSGFIGAFIKLEQRASHYKSKITKLESKGARRTTKDNRMLLVFQAKKSVSEELKSILKTIVNNRVGPSQVLSVIIKPLEEYLGNNNRDSSLVFHGRHSELKKVINDLTQLVQGPKQKYARNEIAPIDDSIFRRKRRGKGALPNAGEKPGKKSTGNTI